MKNILFLISIGTTIGFSFGQTSVIKEIHFPYQDGYRYTMCDTTIQYDQYNFQVEQTISETKYNVTTDPTLKDILIFRRETFDKEKEQVVSAVMSFLTLGKAGMSWWRENEKPFNAIKLPLKKGSKWSAIFNEKKATVTCTTIDTILKTMYGDISCFCISTKTINKETDDYKTYTVVNEYYNDYAGKVWSEWINYIFINETSKEMIQTHRWGGITQSNLTVEQRQFIK